MDSAALDNSFHSHILVKIVTMKWQTETFLLIHNYRDIMCVWLWAKPISRGVDNDGTDRLDMLKNRERNPSWGIAWVVYVGILKMIPALSTDSV